MKINRIKALNYLSFGHVDINLTKARLTSILGDCGEVGRSNGAGKSTIFGVICYGLFGKYIVASDDLLIRDDQSRMEVEIEFEIDNHQVKIIRGRDKSSKYAKLIVDNKLTAEGIRNVNYEVVKLIKMNFDVFLATTFFIQGGLDNFTSAAPSSRKDYLGSILDTTCWDKWHNETKSKLTGLSQEVEKLDSEIKIIKDNFDLKKNYVEEIGELKKKYTGENLVLKRLEKKEKAAADRITQLEKLKIEHQTLLKNKNGTSVDVMLVKAKQELGKAKRDLKSNQAYQKQIKTELGGSFPRQVLLERVEKSNKEIAEFNAKISEKQQVLAILKNAGEGNKTNCPVCEKDLKDVGLASTNRELELTSLKSELSEANGMRHVHKTRLDTATELTNEQLKLETSEVHLKQEVDNRSRQVKEAEALLKEEKRRFKEVNKRIAETVVDEDEIYSLKNQREDLKKLVDNKRGKVVDLEVQIISLEGNKDKVEENREKVKKLTERKKEAKKEGRKLTVVKRMFSKKSGIPAYIIENAIADIEDRANDILKSFGSGLIVKLESQKITKTKKKEVDTLEIFVITSTGRKRIYQLLSGGEKAQVNIAMRLALSMLLSNRYGVNIDTLFIDESMGAFDEMNRSVMLGIFKLLSNRFRQVFVISHHEDLRDMMPDTILVSKKDGVSSAKVVLGNRGKLVLASKGE